MCNHPSLFHLHLSYYLNLSLFVFLFGSFLYVVPPSSLYLLLSCTHAVLTLLITMQLLPKRAIYINSLSYCAHAILPATLPFFFTELLLSPLVMYLALWLLDDLVGQVETFCFLVLHFCILVEQKAGTRHALPYLFVA